MSDPLVSVLMSVFNGERFLRDAVESILKQSFRDEFIVINDGSKDSSAWILEFYQRNDPRVRVYHQENKGANDSLNRAPENSILWAALHHALQRGGAARNKDQQWRHYAEIGTIAHLSIIAVEDLVRPNWKECIEALDLLSLYRRRRWMSPIAWISTERNSPHTMSLVSTIFRAFRSETAVTCYAN